MPTSGRAGNGRLQADTSCPLLGVQQDEAGVFQKTPLINSVVLVLLLAPPRMAVRLNGANGVMPSLCNHIVYWSSCRSNWLRLAAKLL
jgi:hypothetical protein